MTDILSTDNMDGVEGSVNAAFALAVIVQRHRLPADYLRPARCRVADMLSAHLCIIPCMSSPLRPVISSTLGSAHPALTSEGSLK